MRGAVRGVVMEVVFQVTADGFVGEKGSGRIRQRVMYVVLGYAPVERNGKDRSRYSISSADGCARPGRSRLEPRSFRPTLFVPRDLNRRPSPPRVHRGLRRAGGLRQDDAIRVRRRRFPV